MSKVIDAIFENGVFKPLQHVEIKDHENGFNKDNPLG